MDREGIEEIKANYDEVFTECFKRFLSAHNRLSVSLVRQGVLHELVFLVKLKDGAAERDFVEGVRKLVGDHPVSLSSRDEKTAF